MAAMQKISMRVWAVAGLWLTLGLSPAVAEEDAPISHIKAVTHTQTAQGRDFHFEATGPLSAEGAEAFTDGAVLGLRVSGAKVKKSWPDFNDDRISRTLLFQSHQKADSVVLRVRFNGVKRLPKSLARQVRFERRGEGLVAHIPPLPGEGQAAVTPAATPAVAQVAEVPAARAALLVKAPEVEPKPAVVVPPDPGPDPLRTDARPVITHKVEGTEGAEFLAQIDAPAPAEEAAPSAEAITTVMDALAQIPEPPAQAEIAAEPKTAAVVTLPEAVIDEPAAEAEAPVHTHSMAAAKGEVPFDWALVGLLGLMLLALWGLKRWRKGRAGFADGKLIHPISSHMLGPRNVLLLVDVAGEHVLLGTSDKGVQMLTKINPSAEAMEAMTSDASPERAPRAAESARKSAQAAFRQVFNSVTGRVPMIDEDIPDDFVPQRPVAKAVPVRHQPEDDALLAMAGSVNDSVPQSKPTQGPSTRPLNPVKQPEVEEDEAGVAADLLSRIRQLQGA